MRDLYKKHGDLWVRRDHIAILKANDLCDFDHLFAARGSHNLKKHRLPEWRERIVLELNEPQGTQTFYLKRFDRPPWSQQIRRTLRRYSSTAGVEWHWLHHLAALGISVPVAVAFGERRTALREIRSLIMTAPVPGISLEKWVPAMIDQGRLQRNTKRQVSDASAQLVARLHNAGLVHRDLYLAHIFIGQSAGHRDLLSLLDLQRIRKPAFRKKRWIVKDLASLNYSTPSRALTTADRMRWLKTYLNIPRLRSKHKSLIRRIRKKTQRIARHSQKHGLG